MCVGEGDNEISVFIGYADLFQHRYWHYIDLPFLRDGVPAVDIIDLTPFKSYHHTARDTVDKCGPKSLTTVGQVVMDTLLVLEQRI